MSKLQIEIKFGMRHWAVEIDTQSLNDYERIVYLISKLISHSFDTKSTTFNRG